MSDAFAAAAWKPAQSPSRASRVALCRTARMSDVVYALAIPISMALAAAAYVAAARRGSGACRTAVRSSGRASNARRVKWRFAAS